MRFLAVALACLAFTASVSAQLQDVSSDSSDYSLMESDADSVSSSDFDISGKMLPPAQDRREQQLPVQHMPIKEHKKTTLPIQQQSLPIKEETIKTNTVLLQPIVLLPKRKETKHVFIKAPRRQHRKSLNFDIDRTLSYKVSPSIHAANSRSVDVEFTPIFNARMRNVMLSQQEYQPTQFPEPTPQPTTEPVLLPIQESMPVKGRYSGAVSRLSSEQMPVFGEQLQQQYSGLQSSQFQQSALSSGLQWDASAVESRFNPYTGVRGIQGIQGLGAGAAADFDTDVIQARSGSRQQIPDLDYTSVRINQPDVASSYYLLSSFDATLPNVPASSGNLVKLGVSQPLKFKSVLNACVQQLNVEPIACKQVFKAAKMLVNSPVATEIFRSNIQQ